MSRYINNNDSAKLHEKQLSAILEENRRLSGENAALRHCILLTKEHGHLLAANIVATTIGWCDEKMRHFLTDVLMNKVEDFPAVKLGPETPPADNSSRFRPIAPSPASRTDGTLGVTDMLGSYIRQATPKSIPLPSPGAPMRSTSPLYEADPEAAVSEHLQKRQASQSPSGGSTKSSSRPSSAHANQTANTPPTNSKSDARWNASPKPYSPPYTSRAARSPARQEKIAPSPIRKNTSSVPESTAQVSFANSSAYSPIKINSWSNDVTSSSSMGRSLSPTTPGGGSNIAPSRSQSPGTGRTSQPSTPKSLGINPVVKSPPRRASPSPSQSQSGKGLTFDDLFTTSKRGRSASPKYGPRTSGMSASRSRSRSRSPSPAPLASFSSRSRQSKQSPLESSNTYQDKVRSSTVTTGSEGYGSQPELHYNPGTRSMSYSPVGAPVGTSTPATEKKYGAVTPTSSTDTLAEIMGFTGIDANEKANSVVYRSVDTLTGYCPTVTPEMKRYLQNIKPSRRIVGEIAFQLDRRILEFVFVGDTRNKSAQEIKRSKPRYYGYSLTNIMQMITKESKVNGVPDTRRELELRKRLDRILRKLAPFGYILEVHSENSQNIVNKFGLLNGPPDPRTVEGFGLDDPSVLRILLSQVIKDERERRDMLTILDCLCYLAHEDGKSLFMW